jgi:ribonuclease BN (tRNA processing enzyme)
MKTWFVSLALISCTAAVMPASAQNTPAPSASKAGGWITLGTTGGPRAFTGRSQPANALVAGGDVYLVDAGDGATEQLAAAGIQLAQVRGIFLSHLHFDHTGGLWGLLGLRLQQEIPGAITIYGPPGTKAMVDGLVAAMKPAADAGYGYAGSRFAAPASTVKVVELRDDMTIAEGPLRVLVGENTHYSYPAGSPEDAAFKSFGFRFELPGRIICYTGDSGPSDRLVELASNADLLVSELIDIDALAALMHALDPTNPATASPNFGKHLTPHHLSPEQVGELAARAHVKQVVLTHLVPGNVDAVRAGIYSQRVSAVAKVPVMVARDLNGF